MYNIMKETEAHIAYRMATLVIGVDLMPLAAIRHHAGRGDWRRDSDGQLTSLSCQAIMGFTEKFLNHDAWRSTCQGDLQLTLNEADELLSFHSAACYYSSKLAKIALSHFVDAGQWGSFASYPVYATRVSDREDRRFVRALYIWQLACYVFPGKAPLRWSANPQYNLYKAYKGFWTVFPPWVSQQVRCIHKMLCLYVYTGELKDTVMICGLANDI